MDDMKLNNKQLREEYKYFEAHREELSKQYPNLYLIIQNKQVLFALNTLSEAIDKVSEQGLQEGSYLLQFSDKSGKGFVCTYRSPAIPTTSSTSPTPRTW